MKRILIAMFMVLWFAGSGLTEPLQKGTPFPDVVLSGELTQAQRTYLGLTGKGPWKLGDVKAGFVMVQVFSMYCPHCQAEAPAVNELFTALQKTPLGGQIKCLGIGAGNSAFEVSVFKEKYHVDMPLFEDSDLTLHALLGEPGTPHFFLVSLKGGTPKIIASHAGRMKTPAVFLRTLINEAGLE